MSHGDKQPKRSREERDFLAAYDASAFPHPSVAVDVALITVEDAELRVLLIQRDEHPDLGRWSLPGGFIQLDEALDAAAARVLARDAGVTDVWLEQLYTFGEPDRDPRTRVITVAHHALVPAATLRRGTEERSDRRLARIVVPWKGDRGEPVRAIDEDDVELPLAFDHAAILGTVVQRLRGKLDYAALGFELLPKRFTLRELQEVHEAVLGRRLNKDSFRRRILASGLVTATGQKEADVVHRPAELFRFVRRRR
ncbi:MAG: NUDIX domain-containing protein [Acidobacteriota bacterium]